MTPPPLQFSHVGIFVSDLARMSDFYARVLGMLITDEGDLGDRRLIFLSRDAREHHQLVLVEGRPADLAFNVVNQISFRAADVGDLKTMFRALQREADVRDLVGITHGVSLSLYCLDPEGNRIEIFVDCPWYVTQPIREPIDLDRPDDEILDDVYRRIKDRPDFQMAEDWRRAFDARLASAPPD